MKHEISDQKGIPLLTLKLTDGETIFTPDASAAWLSANFEIKTGMRGTLGSRVAGDALPATTYTCRAGIGTLTFTGGLPGAILEYAVKPTASVAIQQGTLIAAEDSVKLSGVKSRPLEGELYGARGYAVQRFSGPGLIFLRALGGVVEQTLAAKDELWVEPAHVLMFESAVGFDIAPVKGAGNLIVGPDERMYHALLKGPGRVWLQTGSRFTLRGPGGR